MNRHESRKKANFSFWGFGRRLCAPDHELEDSGSDAITKGVQSARRHVELRGHGRAMCTDRRSRSLIPLTRFCVYWMTSEKRKANAEAETSDVRVLLMFLS